MSLREVLDGLWWEHTCYSFTTGTGPILIDDIVMPDWARLYKIQYNSDWEIGKTAPLKAGIPKRMMRKPILSSLGIGTAIDWPAGIKAIEFVDHVPEPFLRYFVRMEKQTRLSSDQSESIFDMAKKYLEESLNDL